MRKFLNFLLFSIFSFFLPSKAQKLASILEWEHMLSGSFYSSPHDNLTPRIRYTAFPNVAPQMHYNFLDFFGLSMGLGLRNMGLILANDTMRIKRRNIAIHLPVTFRIGQLKKPQLAAVFGTSVNLMVFYKETQKLQGQKLKTFTITSDKVYPINLSIHAGLQVWGLVVKLNYSLFHYLNRGFTDPSGSKPFKDTQSTLWWLSLSSSFMKYWKNPFKKE
ncbi:MAG: hypothetical protein N2110_05340 [Flavobacteriales bacterium]|nr:hypothetical protein [Flavobacteriales bacterium]MCX7768430.1 hypothetical protein [Flavobacteriales bacterium]MDW8409677.1 hypothetical protein [Flavobacteriales bacterium]